MVTLLFSAARSLSLLIRHHLEPRAHCMTAVYLGHPALEDLEEGMYPPKAPVWADDHLQSPHVPWRNANS